MELCTSLSHAVRLSTKLGSMTKLFLEKEMWPRNLEFSKDAMSLRQMRLFPLDGFCLRLANRFFRLLYIHRVGHLWAQVKVS